MQLNITITTSDIQVMEKIKRLLAWMHWNTRWGHSATIAVDIDGDGADFVTIEGYDLASYIESSDKTVRRAGKYEKITL